MSNTLVKSLLIYLLMTLPAQANWEGVYECIIGDKSQVWDTLNERGHNYFDSDGDHSDPYVAVELIVSGGKVEVGQIFAGKPSGSMTFDVIGEFESDGYPSLISMCEVGRCRSATVLTFSKHEETGAFGFSQVASTYAYPLLVEDHQVILDVVLGHCGKKANLKPKLPSEFSDEEICDKAVFGDPDVADFLLEKLKRRLTCD